MARVADIIERARDTLVEKTPTRYTTPRLLRMLSEGQSKLARELLCVRESGTIELCSGYHTYKLDITNIIAEGGVPIRISAIRNHEDKRCQFMTTQIMEPQVSKTWRTDISDDITHIVYNKQKPLIFRVYPIPTTSEMPDGETLNSTDEPFADAATICQPIVIPSNFDITLETTPRKLLIEFFHTPPPITTVSDTNLLVPDYCDTALKHYIVGMCLRDDLDAQNRSFGIEELKLFDVEYTAAKEVADDDSVSQKEEHYAEVKYNAQIE